jgi:cyclophilin family peptidyl-prolyl cis-trans isomerase
MKFFPFHLIQNIMKKYLALLVLLLPVLMTEAQTKNESDAENTLTIELKDGKVVIELFPDDAPKHVERIKKLAIEGKYDGVAFHRVIDGFMAQTGDIEFGNKKDFNSGSVGTGGSDLPDLPAEFNSHKHEKGTCSMARAASPNSANSQFFICFEPAPFLDNQYTVWGKVVKGMEFVDKIKMGSSSANGSVKDPDFMQKVTVGSTKKSEKKE